MYNNELYHHGILGMKWGIRRFQPYPKGYTGSGREVGDARKVQQRIKREERMYQYKESQIQKRLADAPKALEAGKRSSNSLNAYLKSDPSLKKYKEFKKTVDERVDKKLSKGRNKVAEKMLSRDEAYDRYEKGNYNTENWGREFDKRFLKYAIKDASYERSMNRYLERRQKLTEKYMSKYADVLEKELSIDKRDSKNIQKYISVFEKELLRDVSIYGEVKMKDVFNR